MLGRVSKIMKERGDRMYPKLSGLSLHHTHSAEGRFHHSGHKYILHQLKLIIDFNPKSSLDKKDYLN